MNERRYHKKMNFPTILAFEVTTIFPIKGTEIFARKETFKIVFAAQENILQLC